MNHAECADALNALIDETLPRLNQISEDASAMPRAAGKWSRREILGHLIDSAVNNHHRFVRAQQTDHFEFPPYAQDDWVVSQAYNQRPWQTLIAFWETYNRHLAHVMRHCKPESLNTPCVIEYDEPVTLQWLMTDYIDHHNHHLKQILE